MGNEVNWLITILYDDRLLKCALRVSKNSLHKDCIEHPMELENRKVIHKLLPAYVQAIGPIVDIEDLFDIHIAKK